MHLNTHSDASYLSEKGARSRAAGYFFLGGVPMIAADMISFVKSDLVKELVKEYMDKDRQEYQRFK